MNIIRDITNIEPYVFFSFLGVDVADSTFFVFGILLFLIISGFFVKKYFSVLPSKFQVAIEVVFESAHDLIGNIINDHEKTKEAFPIIGAIMLYILIANVAGLFPGVEQLTYGGHGIFRTPTSDFNTTFGLALGAVLIINIIAIKEKGIITYLGQFFPFHVIWKGFKKGFGAGCIGIIEFFIGLLDIIGEVVKVVSLSLRLFGNMYAGQILMIIMFGFVAFVVPALWLAMSLFVGVLQAIVFAALVASYYMLATTVEVSEETQH